MRRYVLLLGWLACGEAAPPAPPMDPPRAPVTEARPTAAPPAAAASPTPPPAAPSAAPARPSGPTVCGLSPRATGPDDARLEAIGRGVGLEHPDAFASVATTLHQTGQLPGCYLTKRAAEDGGWSPGEPVWQDHPGHAIGGDRFGNREGRLPPTDVGYVEADLDDDGDRRGARRLVFRKDTRGAWRMWITVDHYETFTSVEAELGKSR